MIDCVVAGLIEELYKYFLIAVMFVPLGMWKLVEIVIWLFAHFNT